jgi:hypothetical protein
MKESINNRKMKSSLALSQSIAVSNDKEAINANMPNQYARVINVAKGEDVIKDNTDQTYAFVDEFLEETFSISVSLHSKCMNLLHLPEKYHISIIDGGLCLKTRIGSSFCS